MRTRQMMLQSFQALREILAQPTGYEGLGAWEHVGISVLHAGVKSGFASS